LHVGTVHERQAFLRGRGKEYAPSTDENRKNDPELKKLLAIFRKSEFEDIEAC